MKKIALFALCLMGYVGVANAAAGRKSLGTFGDWSAYTMEDHGQKICYMASVPQKSTGKYTKRGEVFLIVSHHPSQKAFNTVSLTAGYNYKKNSSVEVKIDKNKPMDMFTDDDTAWASSTRQDNKLVSLMRAGNEVVFKGTSARGTLTTDTFSLKGCTKAANAIDKACGRK